MVCAPPDAGPEDGLPVTFTATSTNNPDVSDSQANTVNVAAECAIRIGPDLSGAVRPGGVVRYEFLLRNVGDVETTVTLVAEGTMPWDRLIYYGQTYSADTYTYEAGDRVADTNGDGADVPSLASEAEVLLVVRLFAPAGVPEGTVDIMTLTASADCDPEAVAEAVAVTQVVSGGLLLHKRQEVVDPGSGEAVLPGDRIRYTTEYKNLSARPLQAVTVYEAIPEHTSYVVGSAEKGTPPAGIDVDDVEIEFSNDGGLSWSYTPQGSGTDPSVTNIRWKLTEPLPAGAASEEGVSFEVEID